MGGRALGRVIPSCEKRAPFAARAAVADDGSSSPPSDQNGYTIVEAGSLDAARALVAGHPFLAQGRGWVSVEIFELAPMPM